jgi:arylsulfatase A-like enzyme
MATHPSPRQHEDGIPRSERLSPRSLEAGLAVGLCLMVVLGSAGLVGTDRAMSRALRGVAAGVEVGPRRAKVPVRAPPRLVCLVSLGGLRADRLATSSGEPVRLVELQALAASAVSFRWAAAQVSQPLASLKTILAGKYPSSLILEQTGADLETLVASDSQRELLAAALEGATGTLADDLRDRSYRTAAFTCGPATTSEHGFAAGFDEFERVAGGLAAASSRARTWLAIPDRHPAFLFLETQELCDASAGAAEDYDLAAARLDATLGAFFDDLRELGLFDVALIAVTSDHGERLGEREPGAAGGDLFLEELRVPLVLKFPTAWEVEPREIDDPVELIDLHPTLLQACGSRLEHEADGASLLPLVLRGVRGRSVLVAQTSLVPGLESATRRAVVAPGEWQLIHDVRTGEMLVFDLARDPMGLAPLAPEDAGVPTAVLEILGREPGEPAPGTSSAAPVR